MTPERLAQIKKQLLELPTAAYRASMSAYASGGHPSKAVEASLKKRVDEILKLLEAP
jgi:hypothetical protein